MKKSTLFGLAWMAVYAMTGTTYSQDEHGDIEFAYEQGKFVIEFGDEGPVFEGEFPTDGIDLQFTSEPGFASEVEEGLGIGAGDQITYNVLSDLIFWNDGFKPVSADTRIRIVNRPPSPLVPDTLVGVGTGTQPGSLEPALNRVGAAELDGDFHSDLAFFLEPKGATADASLFGAYGIMLSLSTDADGVNDSDPFAMVFNFGLEEAQFEQGVEAIANVVPEPSEATSIIVGLLCVGPFLRRRNAKLKLS